MNSALVEIYHALKQRRPVVVATIIGSRGSTPRTSGCKMIVYGDGKTSGTIGGGAIEGHVIEGAIAAFDTKRASITSYDLHKDGNSADLDLICGGHMEILLEYVHPGSNNELLYGTACEHLQREQPFIWKVAIKDAGSGILLERSIQEITGIGEGGQPKPSLKTSTGGLVLIEPVMPAQTAYVIGAGHVSREIARLTKLIGMKTLVFDDRAAFACESRFPEADGIHLCPGYVNIFEPFTITQNSYIIIVTRGHSYDREVLAQALNTRAGYIGMMGSRKKRNTIYEALTAEGYRPEELDRVYCPIGLPINAETPAELAVSIVAELIDHRASSALDG